MRRRFLGHTSTEARATADRTLSRPGSEPPRGAAATQTQSPVGRATGDTDTQQQPRGSDDGQYGVPPFGGPEAVLMYLARYTHRVAISNARLLEFEDGMVRFRYKDYVHGNRKRVMTLTALEFVRRLLLHVLPTGFMRLRHYGILANRHRHEKLALCRRLLGSGPAVEPELPKTKQINENPSSITPTRVCPACGAGRMIMIEEFPPLPAGQQAHQRSVPRRGFDSS